MRRAWTWCHSPPEEFFFGGGAKLVSTMDTYKDRFTGLKFLCIMPLDQMQWPWGDASGKNWKYRFTQRDLSAVSNGVISCHIESWSAVISLPLRHLAIMLSNLCPPYLPLIKSSCRRPNVVKNRIVMAPNMKGFALFTCAINKDVLHLYLHQTNTGM